VEVEPVLLSTIGTSKLLMNPETRHCWAEIDQSPMIPGATAVKPLGQFDEGIVLKFRVAYDGARREAHALASRAVAAYGRNWTVSDLMGRD
jgi:hypothetical protein